MQSIVSAERGATTTVILACNAAGVYIPPLVIFKGSRLLPEHKAGFPEGTKVMVSKTGYVDKEILVEWFQHFLETRPPCSSGRSVIFLDGHSSHVFNYNFLTEAAENNVELVCLPAHTTKWLQPLDRAVFGPLKKAWTQSCSSFMRRNPGCVITRTEFGALLKKAMEKGATAENAKAGFRGCGLCPFSIAAIPGEAYEASLLFGNDVGGNEETVN